MSKPQRWLVETGGNETTVPEVAKRLVLVQREVAKALGRTQAALAAPGSTYDHGDEDATLSAANAGVHRWAVPLTATRYVTVYAADSVGGLLRFERAVSATGAFDLDIGPGLIALDAGQWAEISGFQGGLAVTAAGWLPV